MTRVNAATAAAAAAQIKRLKRAVVYYMSSHYRPTSASLQSSQLAIDAGIGLGEIQSDPSSAGDASF